MIHWLKQKLRPVFFESHLVREIGLLLASLRHLGPLRKPLAWFIVGLFRSRLVAQTQQGTFVVSTRDSAIARQLYCEGSFEIAMIRRFPALLSELGFPGHSKIDTVLDIGANVGVISVAMINLGIASQAVAIEPEPENFALLQENARLNNLGSRLKCLNYAVSDSEKEIEFELSAVNSGDHRIRGGHDRLTNSERCAESRRPVIAIRARPLDHIVAGLPSEFRTPRSLVWIDVQGHEGFVFLGGQSFLRTGVPAVAEFWPYGILRSGMAIQDYVESASSIWDVFFDLRHSSPPARPISELAALYGELSVQGAHTNLIFKRRA